MKYVRFLDNNGNARYGVIDDDIARGRSTRVDAIERDAAGMGQGSISTAADRNIEAFQLGLPRQADLVAQPGHKAGAHHHPSPHDSHHRGDSAGHDPLPILGDLLFRIVNIARLFNIHPETALRDSTNKFEKRFRYMEKRISNGQKDIQSVSQEEKDVLWEQAKESID